MAGGRAWWPAECFAVVVACSCNDPDVVAHPIVSSARTEDADAAAVSCDYAAQLTRHKLPPGLANVFVNCEWPLTADEEPPSDDLRRLIGEMSDADTTTSSCALNGYYWWQEPPPPRRPQRFVYCAKACEVVKAWVQCKLRDDPCNLDDQLRPSDAGLYCSGNST